MGTKPTTKLIDALSARTHFGELMEQAERQNQRFLVSRRGKAKVVILSVDDYLKNILKKPTLLAEIHEDASSSGLTGLTEAEIGAEIKAAREKNKKGK